ncbi:ribonuclease P 21kDa subunit [Phlyctochytrium arcticum]|nr:ribonuclease P 21kDa subunit [Phlyctochytrium arcticum]
MGKQDKRKTKKGGKSGYVEHREAFQRMNFLYQAASMLAGSSVRQEVKPDASDQDLQSLARYYSHTCRQVERKLVLRSHPKVKRTICKGCELVLVPGITSTSKTKERGGLCVVKNICLECEKCKVFPVKQGLELYADRAMMDQGRTAPQQVQ